MKVAFLVAPEGVEQVELTDPWQAVRDAGGTPRLVSTKPGRIQAFNHLDKADTFEVDQVVKDATVEEYDALVLPGGVANPDFLRLDRKAVAFAKGFFDAGKPVAAICHAPWTAGGGRCGARPHPDLVAEPADRYHQRRRDLGGRAGQGLHGRAQHADHQP